MHPGQYHYVAVWRRKEGAVFLDSGFVLDQRMTTLG